MSQTPYNESKYLSSLSYDLDKARYTFIQGDKTLIYPDPILDLYNKYYYLLMRNSEVIHMKPRYIQRPDYASYDYYGVVSLWPVILYVNDTFDIMDFTQPIIAIPNKNQIVSMVMDIYNYSVPVEEYEREKDNSQKPVPWCPVDYFTILNKKNEK